MGERGETWIIERNKKLKELATKENKGSERQQQVEQTKRKEEEGENRERENKRGGVRKQKM